MSWNKGNSLATNRKIDIDLILDYDKPEILVITEFNLEINEDINKMAHINYNMELDNLYEKNGICRTAIYIRKNIIYQRTKKIMKLKTNQLLY